VVGPRFRQDVVSTHTFATWANAELERVALEPSAPVAGWLIEPPLGIFSFITDARQPRPRLQLVPKEPDFAFEPDEPPEVRAMPPPPVRHVAIVEPALIRAIAELFHAASAAQKPVGPLSRMLAEA
jgi:hypothetical protein